MARYFTLFGLLAALAAACGDDDGTTPMDMALDMAADCGAPEVLATGTVDVARLPDVHVPPSCVDYRVPAGGTNRLGVNGALTIEPGVVIAFEAETGVRVSGEGSLSAVATDALPIRFQGATAAPGAWAGLFFDEGTGEGSVLEGVTVRDAGGAPLLGDVAASLVYNGSGGLRVSASRFEGSAGYGAFLNFRGRATLGANTFTGNALGPVLAAANVGDTLDAAGSYGGNDVDAVSVLARTVDAAATWNDLGVPYRVLEDLNPEGLAIRAQLTVAAGTTIELETGMAMNVVGGGGLTAVGTASEPITFTRAGGDGGTDFWKGLRIGDTTSTSTLTFVDIAYGGSSPFGVSDDRSANLVLTQNSDEVEVVRIEDCTLRDGAGYGLFVRFGIDVDAFARNAIRGNAEAPIFLHSAQLGFFDGSDTLTGNGRDQVEVFASATLDSEDVDDPVLVPLGVPYVVIETLNPEGFTFRGVTVTLQPGVEMAFGPDMGFLLRDEASLQALGTEEDPIVIRAETTAWRGLLVDDSMASLDWVEIRDGGSTAYGTLDGEAGNISVRTFLGGSPPSAMLTFDHHTSSGAPNDLVIGSGDAFAAGGGCGEVSSIYRRTEEPRPKCN